METLPSSVVEGLEFEKSNWAQASVLDDPFTMPLTRLWNAYMERS